MKTAIAALAALLAATAAVAAEERPEMRSDAFGTHNPEELSLRGAIDRLRRNEAHPMLGALGYGAAKSGDHDAAREIFSGIANRGNVQGMTWLAWLEDNGLGGPENAAAAAYWDRRSMQAGSTVGMFNHGLNLLRGRGVARDEEAGRAIIERAAALGEPSAQHLIDNDWDLDSVTPDADEWKYKKLLF